DNPDQGVMVFCKECLWSTYDIYYNILEDIKKSIIITCMKFDIPFNESDYNGTIKEYLNKPNAHPMKIYMTKINSLGNVNNALLGFDPKFLFDKDTGKDLITNALSLEAKDLDYNVQLLEQDIQVKEDVIRLVGYDPFEGYSNFDQKFLYNELITYLTEDTLEDAYLLSQVLQLVNNNNQVRKIDIVIASLSSDTKTLISNQGEIKNLSTTKKTIVDNTDKIAKENSISVKNRGDKKAGKSTLTYMMKNLRELGFEDAEHDYYDHMKANGMKQTADISNKSILEQLQFDENDYISMVKDQREIIQKLQEKVDDIEEENRQLNIKLDDFLNN
ncbi:MAG: hypothetical protein PHR25_07010, partial [Clostridia bacterium]|nr:hypothetical protein [Clostridia bacterium]